jgi:hypothetical protein
MSLESSSVDAQETAPIDEVKAVVDRMYAQGDSVRSIVDQCREQFPNVSSIFVENLCSNKLAQQGI